ncbi:MAG: hypothetical protein NVSMB2_20110 [Chloroflexota bacterium]
MWRAYVICVLIGLLLVSTGGNVLLTRQVMQQTAATARLAARVAALENRTTAAPTAATVQTAPVRPNAAVPAAPLAVPTPRATAQPSDPDALQSILNDVTRLRGLTPLRDVPIKYLDDATLHRFLVDRFNADYLPIEREADQKLLSTIGLIDPKESVSQTLLDVLQEQVLGVYNPDDKFMYLLGDTPSMSAAEKDTFAHEITHALQDQYYELSRLAPKHPANDDRALAVSALTEGDAVLIQRLWAQQKPTSTELAQLGAGGTSSALFSAPLYLREQLLFPYTDGFAFVRQIYQTQGGYPAVDDIFRNPPESTAQILHPDKYRSHTAPVDVSLDVLPAMGDGWRTINSNVLGELDCRGILEQLTDRAHAVPGASGWSGDRWQLVEKDSHTALVSKSVWDNDAAAKRFFETLGLGMQQRYFGAQQDEWTATREALTAPAAAVEIHRDSTTVTWIIAADRATAQALYTASQ